MGSFGGRVVEDVGGTGGTMWYLMMKFMFDHVHD